MQHSNHLRSLFTPFSATTVSTSKRREYPWRILAVYCLAVLGFIVMSLITGDRYWPVQLFGYVRDMALLLALLPLPIVLWKRRRHPMLLQLLCAVSLLGTSAGAQDLARIAPEGSIEVNVMTYNLGNGQAGPDELPAFLEQTGADIIGLQEVSPQTALALETGLTTTYPYQVVYGFGIPGKGLLSKYPIIEYQLLAANPDRPDLLATVDIDGVLTTVIVAHPPPPKITSSGVKSGPEGNEQFAHLIDTISRADGPVLLLADLNITQHHERYEQLQSIGLTDAYGETESGVGYTYPARMSALDDLSQNLADTPMVPLLRIDYVWGTSHWYPIETRVGEDAGSDHLPVMARMALSTTSENVFASGQRAAILSFNAVDCLRPESIEQCH